MTEIRLTARDINRGKAIGYIPTANMEYLLTNDLPVRLIAIDDRKSARTMYLQRHNRFLRNSIDYEIMQIITDYINAKCADWDALYQLLL